MHIQWLSVLHRWLSTASALVVRPVQLLTLLAAVRSAFAPPALQNTITSFVTDRAGSMEGISSQGEATAAVAHKMLETCHLQVTSLVNAGAARAEGNHDVGVASSKLALVIPMSAACCLATDAAGVVPSLNVTLLYLES